MGTFMLRNSRVEVHRGRACRLGPRGGARDQRGAAPPRGLRWRALEWEVEGPSGAGLGCLVARRRRCLWRGRAGERNGRRGGRRDVRRRGMSDILEI